VSAADGVAACVAVAGDTTALAPLDAAFACVTAPLSPGLLTRTDTLTFAGVACCVPALDAASVGAGLALVEPLAATFACATEPSVPGLSTRTETLTFAGDA